LAFIPIKSFGQIPWNNKTFDGGPNGQTITYNVNPDIYIVSGTLTIWGGAVVNFTNSEFRMEPGAKIEIKINPDPQNGIGGTLNIGPDACYFHADGQAMWDGIYILDDKSYINSHIANIFEDAYCAIFSVNGGNFEIYNGNIFDKNDTSLVVRSYHGDHAGQFYGNTISCTANLLGTTNKSSIGIKISDVISISPSYKLKIGDANGINYISDQEQLAIEIVNSDVEIAYNDVDNTNANAIHIMGGVSSSDLREVYFHNNDIHSSNSNAVKYAIWAIENFNGDFQDNTFDNTGHIYNQVLFSNIYGTLSFQSNTFTYNSTNTIDAFKLSGHLVEADVFNNTFNIDYGNCVKIASSSNINVNDNTTNVIEGNSISCTNHSDNITISHNNINMSSGKGINIDEGEQITINNHNDITFDILMQVIWG